MGSVLGLAEAATLAAGLFLASFSYLVLVNGKTGAHDGLVAYGLLALVVLPLTAMLLGLWALIPGRTVARGLMLLGAAGACRGASRTASPR